MRPIEFYAIAALLVATACAGDPTAPADQPLLVKVPRVTVNNYADSGPVDCHSPRARCEGDLDGFDPLFVVDGVPLESAEAQCIDSTDIENVQILKGLRWAPSPMGTKPIAAILVTTKSRRPLHCSTS